MEYKNYNKLVNITKKKQTHRYKEQTNDYQWWGGEGQYRDGAVGGTNSWVKGYKDVLYNTGNIANVL